ncbi:O-antigen/teichoic acid export membrane protein [Actinoplanes tereljensis]|uniref:Uncharacterized protein n=1 Tax=Paractinoplanes tereljensis TaxID=571912 RepID=A0A919NPQ4_9ACTN|nr:hypothetical protein [Actinoplanes tereljensis]GIF22801.1 hypothetical protein Ate02nite_55310 [Actinoplanes tereljensis]
MDSSPGMRGSLTALGRAGLVVTAANVLANLLAYLAPVLGARRFTPADLGALAAALALVAIATMPGIGLQTAVAVAVARTGGAVAATRPARLTALVCAGSVLLATPLLADALRLPLLVPPLLAAMTAPAVLSGRPLGVLQGSERFGRLAGGTVLLAVGRYGGVLAGMVAGLSLTGTFALGALVAWSVPLTLSRLLGPLPSAAQCEVPAGPRPTPAEAEGGASRSAGSAGIAGAGSAGARSVPAEAEGGASVSAGSAGTAGAGPTGAQPAPAGASASAGTAGTASAGTAGTAGTASAGEQPALIEEEGAAAAEAEGAVAAEAEGAAVVSAALAGAANAGAAGVPGSVGDDAAAAGRGDGAAGVLRGRAVFAAASASLAILVASYADLILARRLLPPGESGAYAVGAVLTRAAIWAPQVVTIVALPRLVRGGAALRVGLGLIGVASTVLVGGAALAGDLLVRVVGGGRYAALGRLAPYFVLVGALYAATVFLVNARIAAGARRPAAGVWAVVAGMVGVVLVVRPGTVGQLLVCAVGAAAASVLITGIAVWRRAFTAAR